MMEATGERNTGVNLICDLVSRELLKDTGLIDNATGELVRYFPITREGEAIKFVEGLANIARLMARKSITCSGEKGDVSFVPELEKLLRRAYVNGFCDGAYNFGFARSDYKMRGVEGEEGSVINWSPLFIEALDDRYRIDIQEV